MLLSSLGALAQRRLASYGPRALATTAWALARAEVPAADFFEELTGALPARAAEFSGSELASLAWALGRAGHAAPQLLDTLAARALTSLDSIDEVCGAPLPLPLLITT